MTAIVAIIGQGYVGLNLSIAAAKAGHNVLGFDINALLVQKLNGGNSHVEGILDSEIQDLLDRGVLRFSSSSNSIKSADVIVIAVPTGLDETGTPDLSNLRSAVKLVIQEVERPILLINESTSYPGTLREEIVIPMSKTSKFNHLFASSPERVDPANLQWNLKNTPRLIAGVNIESLSEAKRFYSTFCDVIIEVSSPEVAEAAKLLENSFRLVNISFINEFATILVAMGIDPTSVIEAASTKPYGFMKFTPSAGAGGHCIPIDPVYFQRKANEFSMPSELIAKSLAINNSMTRHIIESIKIDHNGSLHGLKVNIVGLAYKPNVADVRESPSLNLRRELLEEGAEVTWFDPLVSKWKDELSTSPARSDITILVIQHANFDYSEMAGCNYIYDVKRMKRVEVNHSFDDLPHQ